MNSTLPLPLPSRASRWSRGFTLVEVSLAMGVVSFGLLSLISLLTIAMDCVRGASSDLVGSQIASRLMGELQAQPWDQLALRSGEITRYDAEGKRVGGGASTGEDVAAPEATPQGEAFSVYTVRLEMGTARNYGRDLSIYVASASEDRGEKLIADYLSGSPGARSRQVAVYAAQLVRLEK